MRLPELERQLRRDGWVLVRVASSHRVYRHSGGATTCIAAHSPHHTYSRGELRRIQTSLARALERQHPRHHQEHLSHHPA
jgi:predicted RNA binding protein YcfA (HicA-like mRNA interferase family)